MECSRSDCKTRAPAIKRVIVRVWADRKLFGEHPPLDMHTGIVLCEECSSRTDWPKPPLFTPEGLERITAAVVAQGKAAPDWSSAQIVLVDVGASISSECLQ